MADSIHKQVIDRIEVLLTDVYGKITVEVNTPIPEEIPEDGLIIIRDGIPDPTEEFLGGFDTIYMEVVVPIEVYVTAGKYDERDTKYDELLQAVSAVMLARDANTLRSLGGLVKGVIPERPEPVSAEVLGAAPVKASTLKFRIGYDAPTALA